MVRNWRIKQNWGVNWETLLGWSYLKRAVGFTMVMLIFFMPVFAWLHTLWHGGLQWIHSYLSNHKPGFDGLRWKIPGPKMPANSSVTQPKLNIQFIFLLPQLIIINRFNQLQLRYSVEQAIITPLNVTVPHPTLFVTLLSLLHPIGIFATHCKCESSTHVFTLPDQ